MPYEGQSSHLEPTSDKEEWLFKQVLLQATEAARVLNTLAAHQVI